MGNGIFLNVTNHYFYRNNQMSQPDPKAEIEERKEQIIDNLTDEQEDVLKNIHAEEYHGTDDDMPDDYERWLTNINLMDLEAYLEL